MGLHLLLRPPRVKYLTQFTQLNGLWAVSKKSAGFSYSAPPPGGTPGSQCCPASLTAVANLPLEKTYLNPFLSS